MNPWDHILNTLGWFILVILVVVMIAIVSAIVIGVVEYYIKRYRRNRQ